MTTSHMDSARYDNRSIVIWLLICCLMIFAMVVVGGITRLTGSGLSMVQWQPILGVLPPLTQQQWQDTFAIYQQSPEFIHNNFAMGLSEFKSIFWMEFAHRILGRGIGVIFFIPMVYFIVKRRVSRELLPRLIAMFILGGLQGLLGWYMVKSGLIDKPHVSQYRLAAHLGLAALIYAFILWTALDLLFPKARDADASVKSSLKHWLTAIIILVFVTMLSGAFVAGLKAGLIFNTFPMMDGKWIPEGILDLKPFWKNIFENLITVQFNHRVLATLVFILTLSFWLNARRLNLARRGQWGIRLFLAALAIQISLGISTLLLQVPIPLAAAHQAGALLLLTAAIFVRHALTDNIEDPSCSIEMKHN